jgi:tungstate transport system substrate-binding protein
LRPLSTVAIALLLIALTACGSSRETDVILATTTSTNDSGLLDILVPDFESISEYNIKPVAVGTGKALAMAERGEADVLLVHAPTAEKALVESGIIEKRSLLMHNFFQIVGPEDDPARVAIAASATNALRSIAQSSSLFISRGDDSGTHKMEQSLWQAASLSPGGNWYQESGQGMGATLRIASEKAAYTLTDHGTYLALKGNLDLIPVLGQDPSLVNIYSVLELNPKRFDNVNTATSTQPEGKNSPIISCHPEHKS